MAYDIQSAQRIAIIGSHGAGKTTLAFELQRQTGLPLYHTDQFTWSSGWRRMPVESVHHQHAQVCHKERWIIEGLGFTWLPERLARADLIIFLDASPVRCLWRAVKRSLRNHGREVPGCPTGCRPSVFSWQFLEFLREIWRFPATQRSCVLTLLEQERRAGKRVVVVHDANTVDLALKNDA